MLRSVSNPSPVSDETGTIGQPSQKRTFRQLADFLGHELNEVRINQIDLRDRNQTGLQPQQIHDLKVLARLRHHTIIGRDDQHSQVHSRRAGDHVSNEAFVSGNVNHAELEITIRPVREAKIDRNASRLFFGKPIRVRIRQPSDKPSLAVIDVPGRADDDMSEFHPAFCRNWSSIRRPS